MGQQIPKSMSRLARVNKKCLQDCGTYEVRVLKSGSNGRADGLRDGVHEEEEGGDETFHVRSRAGVTKGLIVSLVVVID